MTGGAVHPDSFPALAAARCAALFPDGARICVGLSGGVDSVVLLHLLHDAAAARDWQVDALHVHHGLSPRADAWARFCEDLCAALGVPLAVHRVDIGDRAQLGTEDAARRRRHRCFLESGAPFVALAHHADDQAETVLLQLLRGAGPAGLAAMPERRTFAPGREFVRPLLSFPRAAIRAFADARDLRWVDDESNDDTRIPRNHLRGAVLPVLEARFPGYRRTLARAAENAADAASLTAILAQQDLAPLRVTGGIDVRGLVALEPVRAANALRFRLAECDVRPPARDRLLEHLRQLAVVGRDHRLADLEGDRVLVVRDGVLRVERVIPDPGGPWSVPWNGERRVALPDGRTLAVEPVAGEGPGVAALAGRTVEIANRAGGERLRIAANRPHRTLKNLFAEAGIPAWERDHVPLVRLDGRVVWACGVGGEPDIAAGPGEPGWRFRIVPTDVDGDGIAGIAG